MKPSAKRVAKAYSSPQRVKSAAKAGDEITVGDKVRIRTSRGDVEVVVAEVTQNYRARKFPFQVRFVTEDGSDFRGKRPSISYAHTSNANTKYLGRSRKTKILQESRQRRDDIAQRKQDKAYDGAGKLRDLGLKPGDVIRYQYKNTTVREVVGEVNYRTGKVGIERFTDSQKRQYLEDFRARQDSHQRIMMIDEIYMGGELRSRGKRGPSKRTLRWLPASGILEVVKS